MSKVNQKNASFLLLLLFALACGERRKAPDLESREDFMRLRGLCVEFKTNVFVDSIETEGAFLTPTDGEPGPRVPGTWIEPAGTRVVLDSFIARSGFDGVAFYSYGVMIASDGRQVKVTTRNLMDGEWFRKATRAALKNLPPIDFPVDRPPLDYRFFKVCEKDKD